jgi:peptidoglycan/xylan/chitin deacetylase (PgdA/CDA1 family)
MAAARLAQAEGAKWSKPLVGALRGLLAQREGWDEDARLRAQISAWGLSRTSGKGCATLWSLLGGTLENNSGRVAPLLPHIRHSCVRGKGKLLAKHGLAAPPEPAFVPVGETDMPTFEAAPIACDDVRIQVAAMAMNKALWSGGEIPPVVADRIVERLCQPQVQAAGWSVGTVLGMGKASRFIEPGPYPDNAQTRKTVEAAGLYPEGFDSFDPHPEQPSWYPKHIKITIDDGPRPGLHTKLHRVLDAHGVKVSFFMCGVNIIASDNKNPAAIKKALERLIEKGHHIAYHSMNHAKGRSEHLIMMTDKQFKDDVDFFRLLLASLVGKEVPLVYGRMPGGLGSYRAESRKAYHGAGLNAPVFWNMGPPAWNAREKLGVVRSLACKLKKKKGDVILLLHETANLENELRVFFERLKQCR